MTLAIFTIYLIVTIIATSLAIGLAHVKHRTWMLWGIMAAFFPPVVILLFFLSKRSGKAPYEDESMGDGKDDLDRDEGWFY